MNKWLVMGLIVLPILILMTLVLAVYTATQLDYEERYELINAKNNEVSIKGTLIELLDDMGAIHGKGYRSDRKVSGVR